MDLFQYQSLLNQVKTLNSHYKRINEITGENFNVFQILKLESSEVRLHSAIIAELLDPKGTHGQKEVFLKLFAERFCLKNNLTNLQECKVEVEKHTSLFDAGQLERGILDIIITDSENHHVIIENKIYAGDQQNQLVKYLKFAPNADLLYLTLTGSEPSDFSKGNLENGIHYHTISYETDIIEWLEECRKEVSTIPIVRETITQYIHLLKFLTNQTLNNNMEKELNNLIKSNLEASFILANNLDNSLDEIKSEFVSALEVELEKHNLKLYETIKWIRNYTGFYINKPDWQNVNIGFQFWNFDKEMKFGIICKKEPNNLPVSLREELNKISGNSSKQNLWWPWYIAVEEPYSNWSKYEAWKAILNGDMTKIFIEKTLNILSALKAIEVPL